MGFWESIEDTTGNLKDRYAEIIELEAVRMHG